MPKLHLSIHVDQNGLQTINSDGDPSLWPLVGRLAAAASPIQQPTATIVINAAAKTPDRDESAELVDRIDDLLRPLVLADEGDGPEAVASAAAGLIKSLEADNVAVRAVLEEAIGRTPDPSRSTLQLAHDLASTLAHAIR